MPQNQCKEVSDANSLTSSGGREKKLTPISVLVDTFASVTSRVQEREIFHQLIPKKEIWIKCGDPLQDHGEICHL